MSLTSIFPSFSLFPSFSKEEKIAGILSILATIPVFLCLNNNFILGLVVSVLIGFLLGFLMMFFSCKNKPVDQNGKSSSPDYKKISQLSLWIVAVYLIYAICYILSSYVENVPAMKIFAIIIKSILGALIVGIIAATVIINILKNTTFCI